MEDRLPLRLSHTSGLPLYRQLTEQLAQLIRSGQLAPGSALPAMRALAEQLEVSMITVRRSYADLEALELVVRRRGRGTRVAENLRTAVLDQKVAEIRERLLEVIDTATRLGIDQASLRAIFDVMLDRRQTPEAEAGDTE